MDLFDRKGIKPMLLSEQKEPFDSPEFLFELKLDGIRCIAYIDGNGIDLRNKRNFTLLDAFPELLSINAAAKSKCILDGELVIMNQGKPDFEAVRRRAMLTNPMRRGFFAQKHPACFVAFDLLYLSGTELVQRPLFERKKLLAETIESTPELAVSQFIDGQGIAFYRLTQESGLEGIVAKRKTSQYFFDRRSSDWIKLKHIIDEDFIACGYIRKGNAITLVLGQYRGESLIHKGHVSLGVTWASVRRFAVTNAPSFVGMDQEAVWFREPQVCVVAYMERTSSGGMRQPCFKRFRDDKSPKDCVEV